MSALYYYLSLCNAKTAMLSAVCKASKELLYKVSACQGLGSAVVLSYFMQVQCWRTVCFCCLAQYGTVFLCTEASQFPVDF